LWATFPLDIPPNLAPLVLERAKDRPLAITYFPMPVKNYLEHSDGDLLERSQVIDEVETMELLSGPLEYVLREVSRWRTIDFTLSAGLYETVERLLEAPTSALEVLRVSVKYPAFTGTMGPFTLSPGLPLKELTLYRVCTSWSSPRFTGLIRLNLGDTNSGPSVNQLLRILSNSPRLEHLSLTSLKPPEYGSSSSLSWSSGPIILDRLQTVQVLRSGTKYTTALLSSTQFPRAKSIHLWDGYPGGKTSKLDTKMWSAGNEQTAAVLGLNVAERRRLIVVLEENGINFKNQDSQLQEHFDVIICREDFAYLLPFIEEYFGGCIPIPDVKLEVGARAPLLSLLPWSSLLRSLHVKGSKHCRKAFEELAKQSPPLGLENASWMCPGLSEITLEYDQYEPEDRSLDIEPLRFLLSQRWSDRGSEEPSVTRPASFTVICHSLRFPQMWDSQAELREILPSFRMVDM
ncbi:hypothetical protein FRC01_001916, partial [Tulasnella sp. 417]